ncbi:G1/S regulator [Coccidioides immitis RS]|uniref:G1/S regulator n=4 Tax=Coccidioides immitis TaxID=5501 RepID=J3KIN2_COCIM|nr:G1/S regulator [Coccidioides immitis RS]EAS35840.3 G1/S regulator [Coccidioides immitis RS]KMP01129.1 G1/S regulator [Coccidioides immitis RMSCC 2394]
MATILMPSPQTSIAMSNRRPPLADVPNATNSPHRGGLLATKRSRPLNSQADKGLAQPPLKKQILHRDGDPKSPRKFVCQPAETKLFARKNNAQPTAFERKLAAAREKQSSQSMSKPKKNATDSAESIRQWQKHYLKVFPTFVFYFDSVAEEVRHKWAKEITRLGGSDERFFSKYVTHVVTARPIPPDLETPQSFEASTANEARKAGASTDTVNPSLLENSTEVGQSQQGRARPRGALDKRTLDTDGRRELGGGVDILYRARQMNMKIWTLDKLQRFICAIRDHELPYTGHFPRNNATANKTKAESDLSAVLRNEKLHGPSDRDSLVGAKDLVPFKGPYIYIYDYFGKTRPVMIREYPKVARRQDGAWPQFRSAPLGKCPFVEEPQNKNGEKRDKAQQEKAQKPPIKEKPVVSTVVKEMAPPPSFERPALKLPEDECRRKVAEHIENTRAPIRQGELPRTNLGAGTTPAISFGAYSRGEIAASGIQPSNITSAIRSQMISSTAAMPGAKAGTSKEIHELKRKVLEKNNGILAAGQRSADAANTTSTARAPTTRASKAKALENLATIPENRKIRTTDSKTQKTTKGQTSRRRKDPKPGYCENCREKFDDFEDHIVSRQHRKFAMTPANWIDLDSVLEMLEREEKYDPDMDTADYDYH